MSSRPRFRFERLLVASDGEPAADAALLIAKLLAERDGAKVEVIGVFSPHIPVPPLAPGSSEHRCEPQDRRAVDALRWRLRKQVRERIGSAWPVHVCVGHPPWLISELGRSGNASLVVLGHTVPREDGEPSGGRHTAEQISIGSEIPVLAVPAGMNKLPRLVLVIDDGSEASERASPIAVALLASGGTVHRTKGPVSRDVLQSLESLGADLLSLPLPGHTTVVRSLMGGMVMDVLERARCAVLVTPAVAEPAPPPRARTTGKRRPRRFAQLPPRQNRPEL